MQKQLITVILAASTVIAQNVDFAPNIPWRQIETQPGVHDPAVIRDDRGVYTLLSTNNLLAVSQSTDMITWTPKGRLLTGVPSWMSSVYNKIGNIWAPHASKMGGKYWVYYCGSAFGENTSLIGAMWSPTLDVSSPNYKWTDIGEIWRSGPGKDYNAIDPEILVDASGNAWLGFGSFWQGLRMIAIDPATGKQLASNKMVYTSASRGGGAIEGPSTIRHGSWYYLFAPFDKCCDGVNSTYRTMYGRSATPTGPYLDESGKSLASGGGTQLIGTYGRYVGPGGGSPFHDGRRDYFALHYYDRNRKGGSFLQLREIVYGDNGWLDFGQPFLGRHLALEAEHAILNGGTILAAAGTAASNNEYVGNITDANGSVEFITNIFQAGTHWVVVRFAAGDGAATQSLSVNGAAGVAVAYPKTNAKANFPAGQVVVLNVGLKQGRNSLKFSKGNGSVELDRIDIVRKASSKLSLGAFDRSPNASWDSANDGIALGALASATYENIGFADGGFKYFELCATTGTGKVRMSLGTNLDQEVEVSTGCKVYDLAVNLQTVKGVHDLVFTNLAGAVGLQSVQFMSTPSGVMHSIHARPSNEGGRFDLMGRKRDQIQDPHRALSSTKEVER